jgi:hypothetical protein
MRNLEMTLPFSAEQFLGVFRQYNEGVWPAQVILLLLGAAAILGAIRGRSRLVSAILALLWAWTGLAYHLAFFRAINPAATLFAALCLVQALGFVRLGVMRETLTVSVGRHQWSTWVGALLIAYALIAYPLIGASLGHAYPYSPTFGAPCPTTIFTFGLIVWLKPPRPRAIVVLPALWAALGLSAAIQLGMWEDFGLTAAAVVALIVVLETDTGAHASRLSHLVP